MTKEQEEAIEILNKFMNNEMQRDKLERSRDGGWKIGDIYKHLELNPALETILSMLQEQQSKIKRLECTLAESHARELNNSIYKSNKSREDLEMLHKGWQIELAKKDKIIDLMADFIFQNIDVEEDICNSAYIKCKQETGQDITCINCIKQYFENKAKE